ncbi:GLUG motif-containing protein [Variovorax sp. IB41]|uniref:GLUG motif-containing protein n=1 Tax=Variovorax sp. IB41 TaxID=2779370 RepID=UPI0018E85452|nr:GLUG motif-containing protein [Variovorax sp. IB41]MBJ2154380.1 filamentous hemagglutinin N-terminal domain-containing protein [Variovorax sp. IB41]
MGIAAPQGGVVTSGAAAIGQAGSVTRVDQSTQRATINWQGFGIGAGETVNFIQPNASAITLNRVVGNERSVIDGVLNANGKVFLINSNGVLFNRGSSVNTAGLVASTLDISDADFNAGRYAFSGNGGSGSVINMGTLTSATGGYVALLGPSVSNQGVIVATKGTVALGSGNRISLNFNGDSLVNVSIDEGTWAALVENRGAIQADGGTVILTANAANLLLGSQVNNTGIVQARTVDDLKGSITLRADGGTANVGGTLDASAPVSGDGGTIATAGRSVRVTDDATITTRSANGNTGMWTLASDGFTVGAGANISGAQLGAQLGNTNVAIASMGASGAGGHIDVNQAVNWSADTALTLSAANDVRINAPITATGMRAGLNLNFGGDYRIDTTQGASVTLSGANASLAMNGQAYTLIHSMSDLEAIDDTGGVAAGRYALAGNLDASGKTYSNTVVSKLSGTLAGLGHTISNLTILEPVHNDYLQAPTGLIGTAQVGSAIRDIGLVGVDVSGYGRVGGLVGENFGGSIGRAFVTGTVQGVVNVGGMVGYNGSTFDPVTFEPISGNGIISDSYSMVAVMGSSRYAGTINNIGGLVGKNAGPTYQIIRSSASGNVSVFVDPSSFGSQNVGGLVGSNANGTIADSHATGNVTVSDNVISVGGLVGLSGGSPSALITNSYATGDVTGGQSAIGGLVGYNGDGGARIVDSYATGNVSSINGTQDFGGLVGVNSGSTISGSHASGTVTVTGVSAGGLVGNNGGRITDSYATGDVKGGPISSGIGGLAGANSGTITGSHATGNVSGETAGGLVGGNQGTITDSYASGNVTGSYAAGGLVGQMDGGTISNSRASGNVTGGTDFDFTGGLVGRMQGGDIDNSHATGTVTGGSGAAELVGSNTGTGSITNSTYRDAAAEAAAEAAAQAAAEAAARAAAAQAAAEAAATAAAQVSAQAAAQASADAQAAAIAAAQAAAQATALQARADAGARLAAAATADAQRQTEHPAAQMTAGLTQRAALLADNIVFADKRNFSANIQRIEIDGKVFELEDEDGKTPAAQPSTPR